MLRKHWEIEHPGGSWTACGMTITGPPTEDAVEVVPKSLADELAEALVDAEQWALLTPADPVPNYEALLDRVQAARRRYREAVGE